MPSPLASVRSGPSRSSRSRSSWSCSTTSSSRPRCRRSAPTSAPASRRCEWTVNAYTLTFAVLLLTGAALGDRFGRRRMFVIGLGALHPRLRGRRARALDRRADRRPRAAGRRRRDRHAAHAHAALRRRPARASAASRSARGRASPASASRSARSSAAPSSTASRGTGSSGSTCRSASCSPRSPPPPDRVATARPAGSTCAASALAGARPARHRLRHRPRRGARLDERAP